MNAPDITLFIQVIHFLIAYTFLRKFIFAPALRILTKQEADYNSLNTSIVQAEQDKQQAFKKLHGRWAVMKQSLYKLVPSLALKHFSVAHDVQVEKKGQQVDDCAFDAQRAQLKKVIVDAVSEVKS